MRFTTERSKIVWMLGEKCSPISKWVFPSSTSDFRVLQLCARIHTSLTKASGTTNKIHCTVQDMSEFGDFDGSAEIWRFW